MIVYIENLKELMNTNQVLEVVRNLSKVSRYKTYIQMAMWSAMKPSKLKLKCHHLYWDPQKTLDINLKEKKNHAIHMM